MARLYWFGHYGGCPSRTIPDYRGPHLLVCAACMAGLAIRPCPSCGRAPARLFERDGFIHYEFFRLCPACVAKIEAAGPPRERALRANEARIAALIGRFPTLAVSQRARNRNQLDGVVDGRAVRLTIRTSPREGENERHVFRVELHEPIDAVAPGDLSFDAKLLDLMVSDSPKLTRNDHRWLQVGFRHLGKLDSVRALEGLLATAAMLDRRAR